METIQVVLDKPLLLAANRRAKKTKVNRSELIREALREHLNRITLEEMVEKERQSYAIHPDSEEEAALWESVIEWPAD